MPTATAIEWMDTTEYAETPAPRDLMEFFGIPPSPPEDLGANILQERLVATLSGFFGVLALLLAALGLYGVMSYSVTRRRNEIGIRMALGAEPGTVIALVLKNVAMITGAGLVAGAFVAAQTGRFINALLYNLAANDQTMIVVTAITLTVAAVLAGYLPARRAAQIDPMTALRED